MLSPRMVGHMAAMAGRSICAMVFRQTLAVAIRAPVLPAETAASASPSLTACTARHMEDLPRPMRMAWLGFSSMEMARSVWRTSVTSFSLGCASSSGVDERLVAEHQEAEAGMALQGQSRARNHDGRTMVARPSHQAKYALASA